MSFALVLSLAASSATAGGFIMGAGRWTCAQVAETMASERVLDKGQVIGWVLGVWSLATVQRDEKFVDTVEKVGGQKIFEATIAECKKAPGDTMLFRVVDAMIRNTK